MVTVLRCQWRLAVLSLAMMVGSTVAMAGKVPYSGIPKRPSWAMGGTRFINKTMSMGPVGRERAIQRELFNGNIPTFLRNLKTLDIEFFDRRGRRHTAEIYVMSDYLSIGSDADFVRIPMTPITAQRVASRFGYVLPTPKLVYEIYRHGDVKLRPRPMPPGRSMVSSRAYYQHNEIIEDQLGGWRGQLVVGQKKDVVITNRLLWKPRRVAIYGWHRPGARAIQPLSLVHANTYADYSHGIRLVKRQMRLDGRLVDINNVFSDPNLARGLSWEGRLRVLRVRT